MLKRQIALILFALLILAPQAHSYSWEASFYNPVITDRVVLSLLDNNGDPLNTQGNVQFQVDGWASAPHRDASTDFWGNPIDPITWAIVDDGDDKLTAEATDPGDFFGLSGFMADYRGLFQVNLYSESAASVLVGYEFWYQNGLADFGTYAFNPPTHAPIGGTAWLLASGLLAVVGIRRRGRKI